jgi:hypothetical protein
VLVTVDGITPTIQCEVGQSCGLESCEWDGMMVQQSAVHPIPASSPHPQLLSALDQQPTDKPTRRRVKLHSPILPLFIQLLLPPTVQVDQLPCIPSPSFLLSHSSPSHPSLLVLVAGLSLPSISTPPQAPPRRCTVLTFVSCSRHERCTSLSLAFSISRASVA